MSSSFSGQRAVITGGDRGIGLAIAKSLAAEGATVFLIGRNAAHLESARDEIAAAGGACETLSADLADLAQTQAAAAELVRRASRWDIFVHSAGNPPGPNLLEMTVDYWETTFAIHCRSCFLIAQALAPGMLEAGRGSILTISSVAAFVAVHGHGAYSPAKVALNMLTRSFALEWGPKIRANAICPTAVLTEMGQEVWGSHPAAANWLKEKIPAGRFAEVDDVVALALFLLSPASNFLTGTTIPVDGGLLAGLADKAPED